MPIIYGPEVTPVLSGAIVYEWIEEANNYGIVQYPSITLQSNLNVSVGSPVPMQPEFGNLQSQWAAATPSSISMADYTPTNTAMTCPATTAGWNINANAVLPDTPSKNNPTPTNVVLSTGTVTSGNGTISGNGTGPSGSGSSVASKTVGGEGYGAWVAFVAAFIALGCIV